MEITKGMLIASLKQCADEHQNDSSNVAELCNNTIAFLENKESFNKNSLIEDLRVTANEHQNEFTPTFNICVTPMFEDAARFLENLDLESDSDEEL